MSDDALSNTDRPAPRILGNAAAPDHPGRVWHWVGISTLTGAIALAAIAVPSLLVPDGQQPREAALPAATGTAPDTPPPPGDSPTPAPTTPGAATVPDPAGPAPGPTSAPTAQTTAAGATADQPSRNTAPPPAAPAPSTTTPDAPPPATFRPVSVEAEDPGNVLSEGAGIAGCAACAGGARVRYLGRLTAYLTTTAAGERTITVSYTVKGDRQLKISINGAAPTTHHLTGTDWDTPRTLQYTATVPAGRVSVAFYNDTGPTPDIDKITIS